MATQPKQEIETVVERRRAPRAPVTVRVEYATVDAFFTEFSRNINEGGMFVETDRPLALEERVFLQFRLPGSVRPVKVSGRVVRVSAGEGDELRGMAVEFDRLRPDDRRRINDLVRGLRADRPIAEGAGPHPEGG
jgi:uncharacterized protein (TIGR02266 family)